MSVHTADIAAAFEEIADPLSIQSATAFRVRAYRRAAHASLPGIGVDLASKIGELVRTGELSALLRLRREVPPGAPDLLSLPGLGPVHVRTLVRALQIRDPAALRRVLATARLAGVRGFGPALRGRLEQALTRPASETARRLPLSQAAQYAEPLRDFLAAVPGVERAEIVGSYRRGRDMAGDLDALLCAPAAADPIGGAAGLLRSWCAERLGPDESRGRAA